MAYTASFSVNVGDPTKANDVATLAANDDFLKTAIDKIMADSATPTFALANGVTATTQSAGNNSTLLSTTAYADAAGVSLSGSTNNTIATVTGANALIGEANLTFDGSTLAVTGDMLITDAAASLTIKASGTGGEQAELFLISDAAGDAGDGWQLLSQSNVLAFKNDSATSGTYVEKMRIDSSGNVTIGTNDAKLNVGNTASEYLELEGNTTTNVMSISAASAASASTLLVFKTALTGTEAEHIRIASSGKVGIGNTSPDTYSNSSGTSVVIGTSTANDGLSIISTGNGRLAFGDGDGDPGEWQGIIQYAHASDAMTFATANTTRMSIDSVGAVGFGVTPVNGRIHVTSALNTTSTWLGCTHATQTAVMSDQSVTRAANSGYSFLVSRSGAGADTEFILRGDGEAFADGSFTGSGADYQEFFESTDGTELEVGIAVVLDGEHIRAYEVADGTDAIIGITRPQEDNKNSAVKGNTAWNRWTDKYLTDDWGVYLREDNIVWTYTNDAGSEVSDYEWMELEKDPEWTPPEGAVSSTLSERKLNPAYSGPLLEDDPNYLPRSARDEWNLIGLLGQVQVKAGEATNPRWIKMKDISADVELWYVR